MKQKPVPVTWHAPSDGIGHAYPAQGTYGRLRSLCGVPKQDERYDWPVRARCVRCLVALERGEVIAPAP